MRLDDVNDADAYPPYLTDMDKGEIASMKDLGVTESFKLKKQVVVSASEAAEMILRVDNILRSAPRRREGM